MVGLMDENYQIPAVETGERVEVNGSRGTVLYVGPVPPTKGIWLGVDWDDPNRGKHDGTYGGVRYFQARYGTSGSLVRREKTTLGQSIISAIKQRYGGENKILDSRVVEEVQKAINAPFLMMVGFDKVAEKQSYETLTIVGVRGHQVNSSGDLGKLKELCPLINDLDLAQNLLKSWNDVADITSQLSHLKFLDLSENRLVYSNDSGKLKSSFENLEQLVLSKVEYTWNDVLTCSAMWPQIIKLQVSFNRITTISEPPPGIFKSLKQLNLEGNSIVYWQEIQNLGLLPSLEILNVSNTGITKITLPSPNPFFHSLKYILLSGNYINNWESISELEKLPSLEDFKFRDNPILNGLTRENARQILIARLSRLKILNGQEIPDDERRGAEYDYLKNNGKKWFESANDITERALFLTLHPRYPELVKKYGDVDKSAYEVKSSALKSRLTKVKLVCGDRILNKPLPEGMTIQRLLGLVQKLFSTGSVSPELILISNKNPALEIPLDNGLKSLNYYSIEEGDSIIVKK